MTGKSVFVCCALLALPVFWGCVTTEEPNPWESADNLAQVARDHYEGMQFEAAANIFLKALEKDPGHFDAALGLGNSLFMLGTFAGQRGDLKARDGYDAKAMEYFRLASKSKPDAPGPYLSAGTLKHDRGLWTEAVKPLEMALERAQGDTVVLERCYFYLGTCNIMMLKYAEAREFFFKILDIPGAPSRGEAEKMLIEIDRIMKGGGK
ncbi:MAG: tetratricopeptide repeat protein [Planctomycetota bacterium]|nr:tetratricopeptide repeat protein [Planctomycetota bacterium]